MLLWTCCYQTATPPPRLDVRQAGGEPGSAKRFNLEILTPASARCALAPPACTAPNTTNTTHVG